MTYEEFCYRLQLKLNPQQQEAVQAVEGPILLLAVPGSGKTTVLVARLGYMIYCAGIAPENILVLTYTVAAARDMGQRFRGFFGEELGNRLEFRTINGICARVIMYYGRKVGKIPFSLVEDDKSVGGILSAIYKKVEGDYATEGDLKNIRTLITYIKNRMLGEEEIHSLDEEGEYRISEIYRAYCAELRGMGLMDYDDQLTYAYTILRKSPETLAYFQNRYSYLAVDEAQDTSKIQHAIIRLLAGERDNLFMVGDEDQSIYGFRAAYPEALLNFEKEHPGAKVLLMEENYRSNAKIVEAADRFIRKNMLRHEKHMRAAREAGADIREIALKGRGAQYRYLAKVAEDCRIQTAVLYRDNESALPLVDLLDRQGLPYWIRNADMTFFTHRVVQDIRSILLFAENPKDTELFQQIYYKISTYLGKQTALEICEISGRMGMEVLDAVLRYGDLQDRTKESCRAVRANLRALRTERADQAIARIVKEMGYGNYLERAGMGESKLFILRLLSRDVDSPQEFLERLTKLQGIIREMPKAPDPCTKFILSTIHASKGLEYDAVYLMDVADGIFPESAPKNLWSMEPKEREDYEEERRLFYVGITRARDRLFLFQWGQKSIFGGELKEAICGQPESAQRLKAFSREKALSQKKKEFSREEFRRFCDGLGEGLIVMHKNFGEGVVVDVGERQTTIQFADKQRRFELSILFQNNLLKWE